MEETNPALDILENYKSLIWPEVKKYLKAESYPKVFSIPSKYLQEVEKSYWKPLKEYPLRKGKYVRAVIIMLVTEALGKNKLDALKTAAAMQVSEDWILIHDDWEDKSETRRGGQTLHKMFGDELAVNAGDGLHNIMWKILLENHKRLGWEITYKIANEFHLMLSRTVVGQAVEINWMKTNKGNLNDDDWFFIADGKTGYYTMAGPARFGGIIGGANSTQLEYLTQFGLNLGRCFQLVDDILDITSDFSGLKQKANDIYEGKRTLLLGHLERNSNPTDNNKLRIILGKSREDKNKEEINWVIDKMHKYGSINYGLKIAKKYRDNALEIFNNKLKFLKGESARKKIEILVNFILERKY